ncbi:hypothetical protein LOZ53_004212 [Ophidiomyces ophidiicola]|uniref:Uncharacterized protein n=1 Tax=Ophidiomyces ophidiicola TaxID=1387563 RepID=A0ACB8UT80_9EURO|nr:hypothetical protein LOZ61_006030 [Ophidiomyces ophidiicola]KAI1922874.1 hypothetical protein LOZ60_005469 [Ophidiomyces ophidiicola]KAI1955523.1 hypothetical protein LOZ59_004515 [Ophidiomyces ophidiicola]KAI1968936.1 hypothetical protein LOZ56_004681 [Ophidiomyces ophidiicola]KAI1972347.1 hypothetical protein LOZ55_005846 [Ophidiomyces ophidiicola]
MLPQGLYTPVRAVLNWTGYSLDNLSEEWQKPSVTYPEKWCKNDGLTPIHKSAFDENDKEDIISARITPKYGTSKTHHLYKDGTGTMEKGDVRQ